MEMIKLIDIEERQRELFSKWLEAEPIFLPVNNDNPIDTTGYVYKKDYDNWKMNIWDKMQYNEGEINGI